MKAEKSRHRSHEGGYRSWKNVKDEFSDLPVSRQRKWQLRMYKENRCRICARDLGNTNCPVHTSERARCARTWGVIGPCIANMLRAGMKVDEVVEAMNTTRNRVLTIANLHGVDVSAQFKKPGRRGYNGWNLRIFLKESLNGTEANPIQAPHDDT